MGTGCGSAIEYLPSKEALDLLPGTAIIIIIIILQTNHFERLLY